LKREKVRFSRVLTPMTGKEYNAKVDKAEEDIKRGALYTEEQVKGHLQKKKNIRRN
jgi:hypothetical protein